MVVFYHYFQDSEGFGPAHPFIVHSYIAVDLFFVLSGFVMALTYRRSFRGGFQTQSYFSFLGKRLGRVYPLYLVVTLVVAALLYAHAIDGAAPSFPMLICNILMIQAWGLGDSIGGPTWSISTELAAYLLFPLLVSLVFTGSNRKLLLVIVAAAAAIAGLSALGAPALHQVLAGVPSRSGPLDIFGTGTIYPVARCLAGFILGLSAFRLIDEPHVAKFLSRSHVADVAGLVVVALWSIHGSDVLLELAFLPLVMSLAAGRSWVGVFLASSLVFWLGEVSYSIYLVHRPIEALMRNPLIRVLNAHHVRHAFTLAGFAPLALVMVVSALTFYGIEKPARNLSRRLMGARTIPITAEPAAP